APEIRPAPLRAPATGSLTGDGLRRPEPCRATTRHGDWRGQSQGRTRPETKSAAPGPHKRRDGAPGGARVSERMRGLLTDCAPPGAPSPLALASGGVVVRHLGRHAPRERRSVPAWSPARCPGPDPASPRDDLPVPAPPASLACSTA